MTALPVAAWPRGSEGEKMAEPTIEYKGETITFSENSEKWRWQDYTSEKLSSVKAFIDRAHRQDFERFEAWTTPGWRETEWRKVTVTSKAEETRRGEYVFWISANGRREKKDGKSLYADTPENNKKMAQYNELTKKIKGLEADRNLVIESMDTLNDKPQ